jgi:hypothetical protein
MIFPNSNFARDGEGYAAGEPSDLRKPFARVLLHVGPGKTGTTSIQHFLFRNRAALRAGGYHVPMAMGRGGGQHMYLPLLFGPRREGFERLASARTGSREERREVVANALAAELSGVRGADTLLLSSEFLFGAGPPAIAAYRQLFAPYADRFESLMYLRRQDRWLASGVLQRRKTGARLDTSLDVRFGVNAPPAFERAVRVWDVLSDRCHIRRFDPEFLLGGSLLEDFRGAIGFTGDGLAIDEVRNRAVLQEQLELADCLGRALASLPFDKRALYVARFLPLCGDVLGGSPFEFPRAAAKAAFEAFASVNTWLRETRDPEGPPFFFSEDFGDYPTEARNDRTYTIEQLLQLSAAIAGRLRERDLVVPIISGNGDRAALVAHVVASFIALHDGEAQQARAGRRAAAIKERRGVRVGERARP